MLFYVVYIQEAHPSDGWQVEINEMEDVVFSQPATVDARTEVASACSLRLKMSIPTLLDEMTNEVDEAYAALPDRLYLIDDKGDVAYRSGRGGDSEPSRRAVHELGKTAVGGTPSL